MTSTTGGVSANRSVMRHLTVGVIVVALLGLAAPASATTTRIEISGTQQIVAIADLGREWLSGPIQHVRSRQFVGILTFVESGGLPSVGSTTASVNINLDTRTFDGRVSGEGAIDFGGGGFTTTFEGEVRPANGGLLGEYRLVGHGYGIYEGMQLRVEIQELILQGSSTFEGVVFSPGQG